MWRGEHTGNCMQFKDTLEGTQSRSLHFKHAKHLLRFLSQEIWSRTHERGLHMHLRSPRPALSDASNFDDSSQRYLDVILQSHYVLAIQAVVTH